MRPDDPIGRPGDEQEDSGEPDVAPDQGPSPSTWAGRRRAGEPPTEGAGEDSGEGGGGPEAGDLDARAGEGAASSDALSGDQDEEARAAEAGEARDEAQAEDEAGEGEPGEAEEGEAGEGEAEAEGEAGDAEGGGEGGDVEAGGEAGAAPGDRAARESASSQDTVEGDTLALVDREEAEEAALAGLKTRAAEYAEKRGVPAAPPSAEAAPDGEDAAREPAAVAAAAEAAPGADSSGEAPRPRALWARFLAASLLIVISTATATSISLILVLTDLARGLGGIPGVERELAPVEGGDPQTLLILGSDRRHEEASDENGARSDTVILLRVDPNRDEMSLLSIPRDLKVNIPGVGVDKFNAAYSQGGPKLTLRVVKQLTGLDVNHVVNIDFVGFAYAVSAIDCVYIDVDRRYFIPPETGVSEIDLEAGYQRLCGLKALQYVRFRHDDNDLVRAARQQDFLREARQKIPPSRLVSDRKELINIFKTYTTSDKALEDPIQLLELLKTFAAARNATVNEVHFPAQLGGPRDPYVTANQREIRKTVREFLGVEGTPGPKPGSSPSKRRGQRSGGGGGKRQGGGGDESAPAMIDAPAVGDYARIIADTTNARGERRIGFPVYYPTEIPASTSLNPIDASRAYRIDGPDDRPYQAYKLVLGIPGSAGFTEYWGVSGTDWTDPPILQNHSEVREIGGREYLLFYDGDRLRLVAWKQRRASYWVNNTLLQSLDEDEMLAIARSMREVGG